MNRNYILIDYENVQPENIPDWRPGRFKLMFFTGPNQKLPIKLVERLQTLVDDTVFITMDGGGKNALDFHIAYHLGRLSASEPQAFFYIVSKDAGFDPLVKHLRQQELKIKRVAELDKIPLPKKTSPPGFSDPMTNKYYAAIPITPPPKQPKATRLEAAAETAATSVVKTKKTSATAEAPPLSTKAKAALENITARKTNRPGTLSKLKSTIKSLYGGQDAGTDEEAIIESLKRQKIMTVSETGKITYTR